MIFYHSYLSCIWNMFILSTQIWILVFNMILHFNISVHAVRFFFLSHYCRWQKQLLSKRTWGNLNLTWKYLQKVMYSTWKTEHEKKVVAQLEKQEEASLLSKVETLNFFAILSTSHQHIDAPGRNSSQQYVLCHSFGLFQGFGDILLTLWFWFNHLSNRPVVPFGSGKSRRMIMTLLDCAVFSYSWIFLHKRKLLNT